MTTCDSACWPRAKRASPCSPAFQGFNTKGTEDLSDLCVEFSPATEDTEPRKG